MSHTHDFSIRFYNLSHFKSNAAAVPNNKIIGHTSAKKDFFLCDVEKLKQNLLFSLKYVLGPKQIEWFQRFVGGMIPVFFCFGDMIATVYLQNDSRILLEWWFQQNAGIVLQGFLCFAFVL